MGRTIFLFLILAGCRVDGQCSLNGTWKAGLSSEITFQPDGTWYASDGLSGGWQLSGGTLTVSDSSCPSFGTYAVAFTTACRQAVLHVTSDGCANRVVALDGLSITSFAATPDLGDNQVPVIRDLSVKRIPDLAQPLSGCSGLLDCLSTCGDTACQNDCVDGTTQNGYALLQDLDSCLDTNCFKMNNALGKPFCDSSSPDPTADPGCQSCYDRVLGSGGPCKSADDACLGDKP